MYESNLAYSFSPKEVDWNGYASAKKNEDHYSILKSCNSKIIETLSSGETLHLSESRFFLLNEKNRKVIYSVTFKRNRLNLDNKPIETVSQIRVWRDRTEISTKDIASKIFFEHLLPSSELIVSDGTHTEAGKIFWELRITDAFAKGLAVCVVNMNKKETTILADIESYRQSVPDCYGTHDKFSAFKYGIYRK